MRLEDKLDSTRLMRNTLVGIGSEFVFLPLSILSSVLITRILSVEDRGIWALILTTNVMLTQIVTFGVPISIGVFAAKNLFSLSQIHHFALTFCLTIEIAILGLYIVFNDVLKHSIFSDVPPTFALVAVLLVCTTMYGMIWESIVIGREEIPALNAFRLIDSILLIIVYCTVMITTGDLAVLVLGWVASVVLTSVLRIALLIKRGRGEPNIESPKGTGIWRRSLDLGGRIYPGFLTSVLLRQSEVFILALFYSPVEVGIYAVAKSLASRMGVVTSSLLAATTTRIAADNQQNSAQLTVTLVRRILWIGALIAFISSSVSPWVIPFAFGSEYTQSVLPFIIIVFTSILDACQQFLARYIVYNLERPGITSIISAITLFLGIPVTIFLTKPLGAVGTALGAFVAAAISFVVLLVVVLQLSKKSLYRIVWQYEDWVWLRKMISLIRPWHRPV